MERYPQLVINLSHLKENVRNIVDKCGELGIRVSGVIKGVNALPEVSRAYEEGGCDILASSRIDQLQSLKEQGIGKEYMLVRIPMLSEAADVVRYADVSLNSSLPVLRKLNEEAAAQGKVHKVLLMVEVGDLREGYWDRDELVRDAWTVENELDHLYLEGVAMNVGCYGSVLPTYEKMQELVDAAELVEAKIGRRLDVISGGATTAFMRVMDKHVPERINDLRIGGEPVAAYTLRTVYGYPMDWEYDDVARMRAEIVEIRKKPSVPIGEYGVDAFGRKPVYEDRGERTRAILAVGKLDYGNWDNIPASIPGAVILGASSDHTIVDVEDCTKEYKVGDIMEFRVKYEQVMYLSNSPNVHIRYV